MTAPATTIEDTIAATMVAADSLSTLNAVFRGVPYRVAAQYWPYALVVITSELTAGQMTGNKHEREYTGLIQVNAVHQDVTTVTARSARITSYTTVHDLVNAVVALFKAEANRALGSVAVTGGAVYAIEVGEDMIEYGLAPGEREDSYTNYGSVPFVVRTLETM